MPGDNPKSRVYLEGNPIYTRVQRLTNGQWARAVRDILRLESAQTAAESLAPVPFEPGEFTNNEKRLFVSLEEALGFEAGAEAVAAQATGTPDALAALDAGSDAETFVRTFGRRAFRRPLTTAEEQKYQAVFALGESLYGTGFANGAALVIRAMLQSPHFLYRSELGANGEPLDGYEVASKLSFWLLGTTPNDALLDAAANGDLDSVEGIEATARGMLETPEAQEVLRDFHGQVYGLGLYASVTKPGVPEFTAASNSELAEASARFFDDLFTTGRGVGEIFTSTRGFVGPELARWYGIDAPASLELRELGPERMGYFMQVPFLLAAGIDREPHSIQRGARLHRQALCMDMPPKAEDLSIPPLEPGQTNRERVTAYTVCGAACHADLIDPLGFAFEGFDGLGQRRERDNGQELDTAASYPFAEGTKDFADAKELMQILAQSPQVHTCYARKLSSYALQRDMVERDRPFLEQLAETSRAESLKGLVLALVREPAFRVREEGLP